MRVVHREVLSPRMIRLTFEGEGLTSWGPADPAGSARLVIPPPGNSELVLPTWNGNEYLLPDGSRAVVRTFTPLGVDRTGGRLHLDIVRHPRGAVSTWAETTDVEAPAAISGPGKGYEVDAAAEEFIVLGDETALPAITDLIAALPRSATVNAHVEVTTGDSVLALPDHPNLSATWHVAEPSQDPGDSLVAVAAEIDAMSDSTRLWAAGAAASMQAIRKRLFDEIGIPRSQASVRGYWKPPR